MAGQAGAGLRCVREAKLTSAQLQTIALGLEASGLPFVWAFRQPVDANEGKSGLPKGFEERVDGRGLVCRGWVPQARFLAHESIGGFLTHAGWNSIIEGLARGVRLLLLPLMFDQGLNARHLTEKKISVEVSAIPVHVAICCSLSVRAIGEIDKLAGQVQGSLAYCVLA
jgi:hypothetical protein